MEKIPVLKLDEFLLVSVQVELYDEVALNLQDDLGRCLQKSGARGVLIDISAVDVIDTFTGRTLVEIASMARLLDAYTVIVGMRPAVAITLVELGMAMPGVQTALNVDRGMALLRKSVGVTESPPSTR